MTEANKNILLGVIPAMIVGVIVYFAAGVTDTYEAGEVVLKGKYVEGKKWYLAIQPEKFVRSVLLQGFSNVSRAKVSQDKQLLQDVWVGTKPCG